MLKLLRTGVFGRNRPLPPTPRTTVPPGAGLRNTWRTGVLAAALGLLGAGSVQAQVTGYTFAQTSGTYTAISGGTVLGTNAEDDTQFNTLPIGFPFGYSGLTQTTFSVNNNGSITVGGTGGGYTVLTSVNNSIAGLNRDLIGNGTTSELRYETAGSVGNRVLTVQWKDYRDYAFPNDGTGAGAGDAFNFQIKLYENGNDVQLVYGAVAAGANNSTPQVGLRGTGATDFNNRQNSGTPGFNATIAGTANSNNVTLTSGNVPANGLTFTYSPPAAMCFRPIITNVIPNINSAAVTAVRAGSGTIEYQYSASNATTGGVLNTPTPTGATITGLAAGTTYYVQTRTDCGNPPVSAWTALTTFSTLCNPVLAGDLSVISTGVGALGGFESPTTVPNLPTCYNRIVVGTGTVVTSGTTPITGSNSLRITNGAASASNRTILVLPPVGDLGSAGLQLRFDARMVTGTGSLQIGTVNNTSSTATFTPLPGQPAIPLNTTTTTLNIDFNAFVGSNFLIAIKPIAAQEQGSAGLVYQIDNLNYEVAPACPQPSGAIVQSGSVTSTSAIINFTPNALNNNGVTLFYGTGTFSPATATTPGDLTTSPGYVGNSGPQLGSTYTINSLAPGTAYRVYYIGNCSGATPTSAFVGPVTFSTLPGPLAFAIARTTGITYTSIAADPGSVGVPFASALTDDVASNVIALPFAFTYNPTGSTPLAVTGVRVSTNGNIQLQGATFGVNSTTLAGTSISNGTLLYSVAALQADLNQTSQANTVTHRYLIEGVSPNRVITFEWFNTARFANPGVSLNFQIKLRETSNVIECVYGGMTAYNGSTTAPTYDYGLGLSGASASEIAIQQVENTAFFQNAAKTLNITPSCNSRITFTPGTYSGSAPAPATAPANDLLANAQAIPLEAITTAPTKFCDYYTSLLATPTAGVPVCGTSNADDDVWFQVTTPAIGLTNLQIRAGASFGFTPTIQVFTSSAPGAPTPASLTLVPGTCLTGTTGQAVSTPASGNALNTAPPNTTYFIRVNHAGLGTGTYGQFVISAFGLPAPPANDNCPAAIALGNSVVSCSASPVTYSNFAGTASGNTGITGSCNAIAPSNDVWFTFVATQNGANISVSGLSTVRPSIEVFSGACGALTSLGCASAATAGGTAVASVEVTAGQTYRVRVADLAGPGGDFTICAQEVIFLANDNPSGAGAATAFSLTPATTCVTGGPTPSSANGTLFGAFGPSSQAPAAPTGTANDDVFYSFVAGAIPDVTVTVAGAAATDLAIVAYSGTPGSLVQLDFADNTFGGGTETLNLSGLTNGTRYYVRVYDWFGTTPTAAYTFNICVQAFPPPGNDAPAAALVSPYVLTASLNCSSPVTGTTEGATNSVGAGLNPAPKFAPATIVAAKDVFYTFTVSGAQAPATRTITVEPSGTNSTTFDPVIQVLTFDGTTYTQVAFIDNIVPGFAESLTVSSLAAGTYYVRVYNTQDAGTTDGGFTICVTQGAKFLSIAPNIFQGPTTTVGATTNNNHILTTEIIVGGATGTLPWTIATFRGVNTANADIKPNGVKLYQSTDITFSPVTDVLVGTTSLNGSGNAVFTGVSADLPIGATYFFLTYDIAAAATPGNTVDAQVQANQFTIGGITYPAALRDPAGNRVITAAPPAFDDICSSVSLAVQPKSTPVTYQQFSNAGATSGAPNTNGFGGDVWFRVTVPANRRLFVDLLAGTSAPILGDPLLEVFSSSNNLCSGTLTSLAFNDDGGTGLYSTVGITGIPVGVTQVFMRVGGFGASAGGNFRIGVSDRPKFTGGTSTAFSSATTANFFPQADALATILGANTVMIPNGLVNQPAVAAAATVSFFGVEVGSAATLTLNAGSVLTVGNGGLVLNPGATLAQDPTSQVYANGTANVSLAAGTFQNLRVGTQGATLTGNVNVRRVLRLTGTLNVNGKVLRMLSDATATALVWDDGGTLTGNATVERYIDPSLSAAVPATFRHFSAPVTTTINDLNTSTGAVYSVVTNPAYNTALVIAPNTTPAVVPFPNIFGYDETRLSAAYPSFEGGYFSPGANNAPFGNAGSEMIGYSVFMRNNAKPDFVGPLHTGPYSATGLTNTGLSGANPGWHLLGNPYPAPIDWATVTNAQIVGMNGAISVARSTAPNDGNYQSYINGVGPAKYIPMAQGFFMNNPTANTLGSVSLTNTNRVTAYQNPIHYRAGGETRPIVALTLVQSGKPVVFGDETHVYFEEGATGQMDQWYDAYKLRSLGATPSIFTKVGTEEAAINGLPALTSDEVVVPMGVMVNVTGSYKMNVSQFLNIPATTPVVLRDAVTGTEQDLRLNPTYVFSMDASYRGSRFTLVFNPAGRVTGVAATLAANQVTVFPNPVASNATLQVQMTGLNNVKSVTAKLVDALGRTVATENLTVVNGEVDGSMSTRSLSKGVYTLRLSAGAQSATRRVVIE